MVDVLQNSISSALTRSFFENKKNIEDSFSLSLLEVLEMYYGPVTLEAIKSGLATTSPGQSHELPPNNKSALEKIRRKMNALSKKGLVDISDEPPDGQRGSPRNIYELPDKIRTELDNYREIESKKRLRILEARIHLA